MKNDGKRMEVYFLRAGRLACVIYFRGVELEEGGWCGIQLIDRTNCTQKVIAQTGSKRCINLLKILESCFNFKMKGMWACVCVRVRASVRVRATGSAVK